MTPCSAYITKSKNRFALRPGMGHSEKTSSQRASTGIKQRHSGERRNPDSATFSWIPDQVRNDVKIRAKAVRLKRECFKPG